jgi:hypothetical protein
MFRSDPRFPARLFFAIIRNKTAQTNSQTKRPADPPAFRKDFEVA